MCSHCVEEYEQAHDRSGMDSSYALTPIEMEGNDEPGEAAKETLDSSGSTIAFAGKPLGSAGEHDESKYTRPLISTGTVATRCRTFHCKLNEAAVEYMTDHVNAWLDSDPQITVKFATSTIGLFEGKTREQHLILTIFY